MELLTPSALQMNEFLYGKEKAPMGITQGAPAECIYPALCRTAG
jgi:hypothetical protein